MRASTPVRLHPWEPVVIGHLEQVLLDLIQHVYNVVGWPGVVFMMAIESAAIPLPSEIIMPLAGWFLVRSRGLSLCWLLVAAGLGATGNTLGSWLTYWIGARGGRPLLERYGRYVLITHGDLDQSDRWFADYGGFAVFIGRLMPVIRTFISLPAGVARMALGSFSLLTFLGSFVWSLLLASAGYALGANYERIRQWTSRFDVPIVVLIVLVIAFYVLRHLRRPQLAG